jgi:hypothetical protein
MNTKPATIAPVAFAMGALLLAAYAPLSVAGKSDQPTYSSAEEASHALFLAARTHDERAVTEILQAGDSPVSADELAGSGNRVAALAYPVAYRSSGVMTFAVDAGGAAYEKDLGPSTAKIAGTMIGYRLDRTWSPAEAKN